MTLSTDVCHITIGIRLNLTDGSRERVNSLNSDSVAPRLRSGCVVLSNRFKREIVAQAFLITCEKEGEREGGREGGREEEGREGGREGGKEGGRREEGREGGRETRKKRGQRGREEGREGEEEQVNKKQKHE